MIYIVNLVFNLKLKKGPLPHSVLPLYTALVRTYCLLAAEKYKLRN